MLFLLWYVLTCATDAVQVLTKVCSITILSEATAVRDCVHAAASSAHEIRSSQVCAFRLHVVGGLSSVTSSGHAVVLLGAEATGVANRDSSSLVALDATCAVARSLHQRLQQPKTRWCHVHAPRT